MLFLAKLYHDSIFGQVELIAPKVETENLNKKNYKIQLRFLYLKSINYPNSEELSPSTREVFKPHAKLAKDPIIPEVNVPPLASI